VLALAFAVVFAWALLGASAALAEGTRSTSTAVDCGPGVVVAQAATCKVTVTDTEGGTATVPTGSVTLSSNAEGSFSPGTTCELVESGAAKSECSLSYTPAAAGTAKIKADYPGDATEHAKSSGSKALTVSTRGVSVAVSCGSTAAIAQQVTCTATVTDSAPGTPSVPTGTVAFETDPQGSLTPLSCELKTVEEHASCTTTYSAKTIGAHEIIGEYGGDPTHAKEKEATTVTVSLRTTSLAISCGAGVAVLQPAKCTATVSDTSLPTRSAPEGTVTFSPAEGTFSESKCTLEAAGEEHASCSVEYTPAQFGTGSHHIEATYGGDSTHAESPGSETLAVSKRASAISVACGAPVSVGSPATCSVTAGDTSPGSASAPSGTITLSSDTAGGSFAPATSCALAPVSASEAGCQLTYTPGQVGSGTQQITATYAGDTVHAAGEGSGSLAVNGPAAPPTTTTTTTTTTPPPPPPPPAPTVPKCRLKAREQARSVAARRGRARETPVLTVTFECDQVARVKITGTVAVAASGHGRTKKKAKTLKLETASAEALVGKPQPAVTMALPAAAAKALSAHVRTLATVTFMVSNEHGTGVATLKLTLVPLAQLKKAH
jgi:hypothetical protein